MLISFKLTDFDSATTAQIMRKKHKAKYYIIPKRNMQQNLYCNLYFIQIQSEFKHPALFKTLTTEINDRILGRKTERGSTQIQIPDTVPAICFVRVASCSNRVHTQWNYYSNAIQFVRSQTKITTFNNLHIHNWDLHCQLCLDTVSCRHFQWSFSYKEPTNKIINSWTHNKK